MAKIFISYSSKDLDKVMQIADDLGHHGHDVWIDRRGIDGATKWASEISRAIRDCEFFVIMLSQHSVASDNVRKEVSLAADDNKAFVPIRLDPVIDLPDDFRYHLAGIQHIIMVDYEMGFNSLTKIIGDKNDTQSKNVLPNNIVKVETRAWNKGYGYTLYLDYYSFTMVSKFLDTIYFSLTINPPPAFTFGETWALLDVETGKIFNDMGSTWAKKHKLNRDTRSLKEAGIFPGMTLLVIELE